MFSLLSKERFGPFFWTQFYGAFNDNVFKNALVILMTLRLSAEKAPIMTNIAAGLFILPFFLFSPLAGQVSDKLEKSLLIQKIKLAEVFIMFLGAIGLWWGNFLFLLFVLFLMGAQSTLFGPVKYSIVPQNLKKEELVSGNALIQMGTFIAILIGTLVGGVISGHSWAGLVVMALAFLGYLYSKKIPVTPPSDQSLEWDFNPWRQGRLIVKHVQEDSHLLMAVMAISWFWFYGGYILAQFPPFVQNVLGGDQYVITLFLAVFSIGIGVGSVICDYFSKGQVRYRNIVLGSAGLSLFAIDLYYSSKNLISHQESVGPFVFLQNISHWRALLDVFLIAVCGGLFIVPLYSLVQLKSQASSISRVVAANNIINSLFMVASAVLAIFLLNLGSTIQELFLALGLLNFFVFLFLCFKIHYLKNVLGQTNPVDRPIL